MKEKKKRGRPKKNIKTQEETKRGRGRPTDYNPEFYPKLAEAYALAGLIDSEIAKKLGISVATLNNWKKEHPDFIESLKQGKSVPDSKVQNALYKNALGYKYEAEKPMTVSDGKAEGSHIEIAKYIEHVAPNVTAEIFWLKNRMPDKWREKQEIEHSGSLDINAITPEERKARIEELTKKREQK